MRRRLVWIAFFLVLGFVAQTGVALIGWHELMDGRRGLPWSFVRDEPSIETDVLVWEDARGWVKERLEVKRKYERTRLSEVMYAQCVDRDYLADVQQPDWRTRYRSSTYVVIQTSQMNQYWSGFPFRSLGLSQYDERLREDPGYEHMNGLHWRPSVRFRGGDEPGVLLPRWMPMPYPPTIERMFQDPPRVVQQERPPTRIRPVGSVLNTLVYASPFILLYSGIVVISRWNRRRRGLCTKCKYQLAGLTTCPECGTSDHAGPPARAGEDATAAPASA